MNNAKLLIPALLLSGCQLHKTKEVEKKPNILFIMTDDHTTQAMSCYGSKLIKTPNIDRIANEGVKFNNCFVTNAICAPSRAVILTGKFSHINGVTDNSKVFDASQTTYPKLLQKAGYQTAMIGKWHLGSTPTGFDFWSILPGQGDYYQPDFLEMGDTIRENGYVTDIITDKAIKWLQNKDNSKPFAMVYQHKAPHRNWLPAPRHMGIFENTIFPEPDNLLDDYKGRGKAAHEQEMEIKTHMWDAWDFKLATSEQLDEYGRTHKTENISNAKQHDVDGANKREDDLKKLYRVYKRMTPAQRSKWNEVYGKRITDFKEQNLKGDALVRWKFQIYMRDYLSCLVSLDENIGRMLDYLKESGELDNTIIVYTSDQGFFLGEHGWFDKRIMYDECYRMPFLVRFPKTIKAGSVSNAIAMNIDFAPTFLDYAGVDIPEDMQGRSLRPILDNEGKIPDNWREASYYHYYEYPSWHSVKRHYGIRTKDYKLIHFYNDVDEWELYDMNKDPKEMNNEINNPEYKSVLEELKILMKKTQAEYKDNNPSQEKLF